MSGLSDGDMLEKIRSAVDSQKLLPLPRLAPPASYSGKSAGVRTRHRHKHAIWRKATAMASALSWLYNPTVSDIVVSRSCGALTLEQMEPHHKHAWLHLLAEAKSFLHISELDQI